MLPRKTQPAVQHHISLNHDNRHQVLHGSILSLPAKVLLLQIDPANPSAPGNHDAIPVQDTFEFLNNL